MSPEEKNISKSDQETILDLNNASSPSALSPESFLHKKQYTNFFKLVSTILKRAPAFKENLEKDSEKEMGYGRVHEVITLHGKRGSGKTTFLLSALKLLKNKDEYKKFAEKASLKQTIDPDELCVLNITDPTLFAGREHLLHIVLTQISRKIKNHRKNSRAFNCDNGHPCMMEKWHENLSNLAKGLQAVGEIREDTSPISQSGPDWEDAEFSLENDLDNVRHSMGLERGFHKIINEALEILGKKAFVLALDDTDTRPRIGWHILEVLRRYFTTPQLIVIVSGDVDLFSTIIRREHIEALGFKISDEKIEKAPFKERIDNLTEQYLLKILRSTSRINIGNFSSAIEYMQSGAVPETIKVKKDTDSGEKIYTVEELIEVFFQDIGCYTATEKNLFRRAMLNNSCRTVVQLLDALYDRKENILCAADDDRKENGLKASDLAFRLCEIFFTQIQDFGLSPFELQEQLKGPHGLTMLMDKIIPAAQNSISFDLLPKYVDTSYNETIIALQANLANAMQNDKSLFFSYLFKACLLKELMATTELQSESYEKIYSHLALNSEAPLNKVVKNMTTLLWQDLRSKTAINRYGMLRLYGESKQKKAPNLMRAMYTHNRDANGEEFFTAPEELEPFCTKFKEFKEGDSALGVRVNTPQILYDNITSWHKNLVHLGFLKIKIANSEYPIFSIFALLSILGDIIQCEDEAKIRKVLQSAASLETLNDFRFSPNRRENRFLSNDDNYNSDDYDSDDYDGRNVETDSNENGEDDLNELGEFTKALLAWKNTTFSTMKPLFATLSTKIMARFFNTVSRFPDAISKSETFLGKHIHRCLVVFFNSVLVEEAVFLDKATSTKNLLKLDNPTTVDAKLLENIQIINKYENEKIEESLFFSIFTCPLWTLYLKPETNKQEPDIQELDIQEPDKQETDIQETDIQETDIQETDKQETDIQETDIQETDKQETDIQETDIQETDIQETKTATSWYENFTEDKYKNFNQITYKVPKKTETVSFDNFYYLLNSVAILKNPSPFGKVTEEGKRISLSSNSTGVFPYRKIYDDYIKNRATEDELKKWMTPTTTRKELINIFEAIIRIYYHDEHLITKFLADGKNIDKFRDLIFKGR